MAGSVTIYMCGVESGPIIVQFMIFELNAVNVNDERVDDVAFGEPPG